MYSVEGWTRDGDCVAARTVARPTTVVREAWHQAVDLGADTVWVRVDGLVAYTFNGVFWKKHAGDPRLAAAIEHAED